MKYILCTSNGGKCGSKIGVLDMSDGVVSGLLNSVPKGTFKFGNYYLVSEEKYTQPALETTQLSLI